MSKYFVFIFLCFVMFEGCKKESLETYSGNDFVYIQSLSINNSDNRNDTLQVNFTSLPTDTTTVYLTINTVGMVYDYKRNFLLSISTINNQNNYFTIDTANFFIPADTNKIIVPIHITNKASLSDTSCIVKFDIHPNDYFRTDFGFDVSGYLSSNYIHRVLLISDVAVPPLLWKMYYNYLGTFSKKKFQLMLALIGGLEAIGFDSVENGYSESTIEYIGYATQQYLNDMESLGETIYEDDGSKMVMGPDVQ